MKIFKIMAVALVAMLGFTACDKECGHEFIEYDYSEALIGTWTYVADNGQAEAMVINPDGTFTTTGIMQGGYLYEEKGTIKVVNNKVTLVFEGDTEAIEGRLELVSGKSMSIVINEQYGVRLDYDYCANDLSEEVVGMWVCNDKSNGDESNIAINTYKEDGTMNFTGVIPNAEEYMVNITTNYKVVGNLLFTKRADLSATSGVDKYVSARLDYTPNGNAFGDILTFNQSIIQGDGKIENTSTYLRIKQYLELPGNKYDYIKTYVSNVKGVDRDVDFMGQTFNFSKMDGVTLDKMLKKFLFSVEFPDAEHIKYSCHYNNAAEPAVVVAPIAVEGNKMTIKIGEVEAYSAFGLKDVDLYTFQDQDNTQMHLYMPTYSFINFFGNTQVLVLSQQGQLDPTDAAAVEAVYGRVDDTVESINLSLIMNKARK